MKKLVALFLLVFTLFTFCACAGEDEMQDTVYAQITMKNGGVITLELYHDIAPITVENFVKLANEKYYDGLIFHRVIGGFMIQGGDPQGTGAGGPGYTIKGEFSANGVKNDISHVRGVISMARKGDQFKKGDGYNTAGSQFFIVHNDSTSLDGQYAAFGRVIEGMEVVDAIAGTRTDMYNKPLEDQVMESVRILDSYEKN